MMLVMADGTAGGRGRGSFALGGITHAARSFGEDASITGEDTAITDEIRRCIDPGEWDPVRNGGGSMRRPES